MEEKPLSITQEKNDYQLSFLYNILQRSISEQLLKNEFIQNKSPSQSLPSQIFAVNSIQSKRRSKKLIKRRTINLSMDKKSNSSSSIKQQSSLKQQDSKKIHHADYVFDECNSFCPALLPIKYGFQIRSLIENNHLPSWRFRGQDRNQIIYTPSLSPTSSRNITPFFTCPSSTSPIPKHPWSIGSQIQHRWINSLLNSGQLKGQHRQLSSVVHQSHHPSSISTTIVSHKALPDALPSPKNYPIQRKSQIKRRVRCTTFEEHLQRYYLPKWCLTYPHQTIKP